MRASLLFLFGFAVLAISAEPLEDETVQERTYPRFMEIPGGDNEMHLVDLEAEPDHEFLNEIARDDSNRYFLFTRRNPSRSQTLEMNDANSITRSNFNPRVPTLVIAHGWLSNQNTEPNPTIRRAALNHADVNVISVDWRRVAASDYATAVRGVPAVGRSVGQFLAFVIRTTNAPVSSMHLIGFSLGAHVVGNAGRELGGRAARITGLDPAGPLWNVNANRLRPRDGVYVEAIHTDGDDLGIGSPIADADFFPNGGVSQPGCSSRICNHNRAWEYFASTITRNHLVGRRCTTSAQISANTCRGAELRMGNNILTKTGSGSYRVNTGNRYPF